MSKRKKLFFDEADYVFANLCKFECTLTSILLFMPDDLKDKKELISQVLHDVLDVTENLATILNGDH